MIHWPAFLKFHDDPELLFIKNEGDWESNPEVRDVIFTEDDKLIDVTGQVFYLTTMQLSETQQLVSSEPLTLEEITHLIKEHESSLGSCCISKISFPSIDDAIRSLNSAP